MSVTIYKDKYLYVEEFLSLHLIPDNDNIWGWYDDPTNFLSVDKFGQKYLSFKVDWYHAKDGKYGWDEYSYYPVSEFELLEYVQTFGKDLSNGFIKDFFRSLSTPYLYIHRDPYYNAPTTEVWKYPMREYHEWLVDMEYISDSDNIIRDDFISSFEVYCGEHQRLTYSETAKTPSRLIYGMKCKECGKEIAWIQDNRPDASFHYAETSLLNNEVEIHLSCRCNCGKQMKYKVDKGHCFECNCGNKIKVIVGE